MPAGLHILSCAGEVDGKMFQSDLIIAKISLELYLGKQSSKECAARVICNVRTTSWSRSTHTEENEIYG